MSSAAKQLAPNTTCSGKTKLETVELSPLQLRHNPGSPLLSASYLSNNNHSTSSLPSHFLLFFSCWLLLQAFISPYNRSVPPCQPSHQFLPPSFNYLYQFPRRCAAIPTHSTHQKKQKLHASHAGLKSAGKTKTAIITGWKRNRSIVHTGSIPPVLVWHYIIILFLKIKFKIKYSNLIRQMIHCFVTQNDHPITMDILKINLSKVMKGFFMAIQMVSFF